jgi:hypothetical protein
MVRGRGPAINPDLTACSSACRGTTALMRASLAVGSRRALTVRTVGLAALIFVACHGEIRFDDLMTCAQDGDCKVASLHCNAGQCVVCASDAHCTTPGLPRCDTNVHRCIACGLPSDCAAGQVCHSGRCVPGCTSASACPASAPRCDDGFCAQCDDGTGCASSSAAKICLGWYCVQCKVDADCSGATPRCNAGNHTCAQCQVNSDCPTATPLCDPVAGSCVAPL